jgi:uncharacterized protein GlcG (DUF336 family)
MAVAIGLWASIGEAAASRCAGLPTNSQLQGFLQNASTGTGISSVLGPGTNAGGLFGGASMWGAVVNRNGELCSFITSTADPTQTWPGSQAIAKAKAYTANGFSLDSAPLSTARLYTLTQPSHSLYGLNNSNPFDPGALAEPGQKGSDQGKIAGGIISFGGGVPIYQNGKVVGGIGVSGDTACADHEVAKRTRDLAGLNPPGGPLVDDIIYIGVDPPSLFAHSLCVNTLRNGVFVGNESPWRC